MKSCQGVGEGGDSRSAQRHNSDLYLEISSSEESSRSQSQRAEPKRGKRLNGFLHASEGLAAARSHVELHSPTKNRISKKRRKAIEEYVEFLQVEMRLPEWIVVLEDEPTDNKDHAAEIGTNRTNRIAALSVSDKFLDHPDFNDALRKQTLIHELLHLHLEGAWNFVINSFQAELSYQSSAQAKNTFDTHIELAIDQISFAFTDLIRRPFKLDGGS